jgi:hypothetical protein
MSIRSWGCFITLLSAVTQIFTLLQCVNREIDPLSVFIDTPKNACEIDLLPAKVIGFYGPLTLLNINVTRFEKSLNTHSLIREGKFIITLCICTIAKGVIDPFTLFMSSDSYLNPSSKLSTSLSLRGNTAN